MRARYSELQFAVLLAFTLAAAIPYLIAPADAQPARVNARLIQALGAAGGPLSNAYYACLLNGLAQGLSLKQIRQDCALQTIDLSGKGFGDTQLPGRPGTGPIRTERSPFDPRSLTAACGAGDARIAGGRNETYSKDPVGYKGSDAVKQSGVVPNNRKDIAEIKGLRGPSIEGYGYGTYGGAGQTDPDTGLKYQGLTKEQSMDKKAALILEAANALKIFNDLKDAINAETDPIRKAALVVQAVAAKKAWEDAHEKALDDPNLSTSSSRVADTTTQCQQALQDAREFLYECHRTDWRSAGCAELRAMMNYCPDPARIFVDPDAGYACAGSIDAEALKSAWVARCEELKRFDPGGTNPCVTPKVSEAGRFLQGRIPDVCTPSPDTYIDPGSDSCIVTVEVKPFGQPDTQKLLVWGLNKLGGPIVVLPEKDPKPPPNPRPGPDPRPPR